MGCRMTLRDAWLSTGATQADVHEEIRKLFAGNAIDKKTVWRALSDGGPTPETRTANQINRALAEIRRRVSRETKSQQMP